MKNPSLIRPALTLHILLSWIGIPAVFADKPLRIEYPKPHFISEVAATGNIPNLEGPRKEGEPLPVYGVPDGMVLQQRRHTPGHPRYR